MLILHLAVVIDYFHVVILNFKKRGIFIFLLFDTKSMLVAYTSNAHSFVEMDPHSSNKHDTHSSRR